MNLREKDILYILSWHVRVLSLEQIARGWWRGKATARRRANDFLKARSQSGWLHVRELISRPTASLEAPLVTWEPGQQRPDLKELSGLLIRRAGTSPKKIKVVTATRKTRQLFGVAGAAHRPKLTQLSHDLFVSEVFLRYDADGLDIDRQWVSEDYLPKDWPVRSRPDALIRDQEGEINRAVEYGGAYTLRRLATLHGALESIPLAYEIW